MRLKGQVAIVTGSSRGVGKAVALALAREGCDIVVAAKTDEPHTRLPGTIHDTADAVRALGRNALPVKCNVREFDDVQRLVTATLDEFGRVDILVNNAGAIHWAPLAEWPAGKFDLVMGVNVRGAFLCSRAVLPHMRERKHGRIVMMSPPVNVAKVAGKAPYLVSKMGMTMLAHAIAGEERESGVAACALWPVTMIESEATRFFQMGGPLEWRKPEILADATVEICCAEPSRVTGRAFYDEEVLRELRGVSEFSTYSVVPGTTPAPVCREMVE
ncbi:MAG: SDR family oxidoreductase [Myxococcales bacterium]|nr:SDR family oxidoreductase [Myxococcales bacterium]